MIVKLAIWLLLGCWSVTVAAEQLHVLVVQSDSSVLYQTFARNYTQNLPANIKVSVLERAEDFNTEQADLIVTIGVRAAELVADRTAQPLLAAMIPSNFPAKRSRNFSAIYLDQPWGRQVSVLRAALPERHKIGVLHSVGKDLSALRTELSSRGETLIDRTLRSDESLFSALDEVLSGSEVLLGVPDSVVYTSNTIRNILLTSYRRGIPLIGFSPAYVRAGALYAVFSTPEQLAAQAGDITLSFAQTRKLPDAQFPALYTIAVNQDVARTLGLTIKSADALRLQIEKSSG
ncbi:MAG: ABC transporter substrate binding protein, partial [Gallionella sp.]